MKEISKDIYKDIYDVSAMLDEALILMVTSAEYVGGHTLLCTFNNGEKRKVDLIPLLDFPAYKELKDESEFIRYGVDGTVFWANGADIAPEYLFENDFQRFQLQE